MKRLILVFIIPVFLTACGRCNKPKDIVARINNYEITKDRFEQEFQGSAYAKADTLESRKEFLNSLINRKLILQDAQQKGLDKTKEFLRMIENFWEQSLLKVALDDKVKEISGSVSVSEKEIKDLYDKMAKDGKADKTYVQAHDQLKWEIARIKESEAMNNWVLRLHKDAQISVNENLLEKK